MSCVACFTGGVKHNEKPTGSFITVHGLKTYVADPPNGATPKGIIIVVPDAFGQPFINNQILADNYASKGQFKVYLPDFMDNSPAPVWMIEIFPRVLATATLWDWFSKPYNVVWALYGFLPFSIRNRYAVSMPRVEAFFAAVRENEGATLPIGSAGFCWGGQHVVNLAHGLEKNGKLLSDANFTAHMSNVTVPDDIKKVRKPLSIAIGDKDFVVPIKQVHEVEAILKAIPDLKSEVVIYEGAGHGFAVRADDPFNEKQSAQAKQAEDQAVKWFTECFKDVKR